MRFKSHHHLTKPGDNTTIWRYVDLAKFLDLVVHHRLYFTNMARLSDSYEGSIPEGTMASKREGLKREGITGRDLEEEMGRFYFFSNSMAELSLVNCWSIGEEESFALWKMYVGSVRLGVAMKSTVGHLVEAIEGGNDPYPEEIYIGRVFYASDLTDESLSRFQLLTRKMPFYSFENEVRLLCLNYPMSEGGKQTPYPLSQGRYVNVEVSKLIDLIYLSPFTGNWFNETFHALLSRICPDLCTRVVPSAVRYQ